MINDLDFLDICADSGVIVGAGGPSVSTSTSVGVGPGVGVAGAQATALGQQTNAAVGANTYAVGTQNVAAARALAWANATAQTGNTVVSSDSRSGGYANGTMTIGYTVSGQNRVG
jgi:hypothetical protein